MASRRGRPHGTGRRWSKADEDANFEEIILYSRIEFIKGRDGHDDASRAARTMLNEGYLHARAGKVWMQGTETAKYRTSLQSAIEHSRQMGRSEDHQALLPWQTLRKRYSQLRKRYQRDSEFRQECDFWIAYHKAAVDADPIDAFERTCEKFRKSV